METSDLPRQQLIIKLTEQHSEKTADVAINLWEQMATQIISLVGEEGFNSLYTRSIFLARSSFPVLEACEPMPQASHRFAQLKTDFARQTPAEVCAINRLLLITFTNILATLIGEQLTTTILLLAWSNGASEKAVKEHKNE